MERITADGYDTYCLDVEEVHAGPVNGETHRIEILANEGGDHAILLKMDLLHLADLLGDVIDRLRVNGIQPTKVKWDATPDAVEITVPNNGETRK